MHQLKRNKEKGNSIIIISITAAVVTSAIAYGIAKMQEVQFATLNKIKKQQNAMQFAQDRADVLRATRYNGIESLDKTKIGETEYYEEVTVTEENNVKTCTISVYSSDNDTYPAAQLVIKRNNPGQLMMNLYDELGDHTDGAMTQKAVTEALSGSSCSIGTCATAAATGAKVVSVSSGFVLKAGAMVGVRFTYPPTAYSTLNVNNTGAKTIRLLDTLDYTASGSVNGSGSANGSGTPKVYNGTVTLSGSAALSGSSSISSTVTNGGYSFALFVYDGNTWNLVGNSYARTVKTALSGSYKMSGSYNLTSYSNYSNYSNYSDYSSTCFAAGSMVLCVDDKGGYYEKPIEQMQIGDQVVGANGVINNVKALDNPKYGLFLGTRKLCEIKYKNKFIRFSSEHEFYVKQNNVTFWGTHDIESHKRESIAENGAEPLIDRYYKEICRKQGIDYYKDIGIASYDAFENQIIKINNTAKYFRYDGRFHNASLNIIKGARKSYPLYHILLDGNHSLFINGFLVSSCQFIADVDWYTYVKPIKLIKE